MSRKKLYAETGVVAEEIGYSGNFLLYYNDCRLTYYGYNGETSNFCARHNYVEEDFDKSGAKAKLEKAGELISKINGEIIDNDGGCVA